MNIVFVKLDSRYADYFPSYSSYLGRALRLLKYMYGMTNSGNLFSDQLTGLLMSESGLKQSHYKYAQDGTKIVVLSYIDYCVYWYTSEALGKWFVDTL